MIKGNVSVSGAEWRQLAPWGPMRGTGERLLQVGAFV